MANVNRAALDAAALVIKNETLPNANTALRVGTMIENLADSALILMERAVGRTSIAGGTGTVAVTSGNTKITLTSQAGISINCTANTNSTITALAGMAMVEAAVEFTAAASRRFIFYIMINNVIQTASAADITTQGSHIHGVRLNWLADLTQDTEIAVAVTTTTGNFSITLNTLLLTYHTV